MKSTLSAARREAIARAFASPQSVRDMLPTSPALPKSVASWMGRLYTLVGVPFHYLVPDEAMLPPESIRFFKLDHDWLKALLDGAFSLGRNLTVDAGASVTLDAALFSEVTGQTRDAAPLRRRRAARQPVPRDRAVDPLLTAPVWTGFIMRSSVVGDYPGLGVNVYPLGHTPKDPQPELLPVRRLERLGEGSNTLICIIEGEGYHVDIHEAPEGLHYGIDSYSSEGNDPPKAEKMLRRFTTLPDGQIHWLEPDPDISVEIGSTFRTGQRRVMKMTAMAQKIATANTLANVNSAQVGFEMTEGVGKVSFINRDVS